MKRGITSRTRLVLALLGAGLVSTACTHLTLVDFKLDPRLQRAYGKVYDSLRELGALQREIGPVEGNNCRFIDRNAQCVDGTPEINGQAIQQGEIAQVLDAHATFGATTSTIAVCSQKKTYCPQGGDPKYQVEGCIPQACPDPRATGGCEFNGCFGDLLGNRPGLRR